jgi:class 3 adenylate cyclase/tetratricopeptide (TPR) repeat protein
MVVCPKCGQENPEGFRFCGACAAPLQAEPASREERKIVTVLFADLVGFTSRAERLDPEDVRSLVAPYFAHVREELERFSGTVEKFIGDAVVALFGAPVAHEDDPERAVRAALAIRDWIVDGEEGELQVRIAITTGEALVALGAHPSEGEGMASGDVVNTAARLQSAAPVDGVLVDTTTYRATRRAVDYREAGPVEAKGKAEPIEVWEALEARSRFGVDVVQSGAALVGRERELELLVGTLARVREERSAQLLTLVGEPGIGKSRLVFQLFIALGSGSELTFWRQGRSLPYGDGVTLWALSEMVKAHAGILETDRPEDVETKLSNAVAETIPSAEAQWVERHLRPLAGLAAEQELRGDQRSEAFAAWRRFFEALAERYPLVLVFEDLQWADDALLDFVDYLVEWASGVPLLVIGTARPELLDRRPGWGGGKKNASTLSLSPLSDEETARLIAVLSERPVLPAEQQSELLARAGGNPLYAEHFVRMLAERGTEEELPLPETVQGIVAARLDGLRAEEKSLLHDAAVIGKVFWTSAAAAIAGLERWQADERLHALERGEFVQRAQRSSVADETEYAFRHVLVRDVAYGQIPRAERAEKHRLAAEWIEALGRTEDHAEMLAHHYLSALEYARASGQDTAALAEPARAALAGAGDRALALNAYPSATGFYTAALELWPEEDPGRAWLLFQAGKAIWLAEGGGLELLAQAGERFEAAGEIEAAAEAVTFLGFAFWIRGQRDVAYEHVDRALTLLADRPASPAKAYALSRRARFAAIALDPQAIDLAREALALAEQLRLDDLRAHALNTLGVARVHGGDVGGLDDLERSLEIALETNSPLDTYLAYNNIASMYGDLGRLVEAAEMLATARATCERFGLIEHLRWVKPFAAANDLARGRWREAERAAEEFIVESEGGVAHQQEVWARNVRATIRLARGDVAGALEDTAKALEVARQSKDPQQLAPTLGHSAWILIAAGRGTEAASLLDEVLGEPFFLSNLWMSLESAWALHALGRGDELSAMGDRVPRADAWSPIALAIAADEFEHAADLLAEIGAVTDEAYARLRAAESLAAEGRHAEADAQLERALAFFREVGATAYLRQGEALLAASA